MIPSRWCFIGLLAFGQLALHGCAVPPSITDNTAPTDSPSPNSTSTAAASPDITVSATTIVAAVGLTGSATSTLACGTSAGVYDRAAVDNDLPDASTAYEKIVPGLQPSTTYFCQITYAGAGTATVTFTAKTSAPAASTPITGLSLAAISSYNAINPANQMSGDTFYNCKSSDGTTYLTTDDTIGWQQNGSPAAYYSALSLAKFTSEAPLAGITVNPLVAYGLGGSATGDDNRSQKDAGLFCMAGNLYMLIGRQLNQATGGMGSNTAYMQDAGQMIWSPDKGATWNNFQNPTVFNAAGNPTSPQSATMFPGIPGQMGSATFVMYCADDGTLGYLSVCNKTDNADAFVYLIANDGYWDSGNVLYLARVPRAKMSRFHPSDYQFFTTGDGSSDASWTTDQTRAQPVIAHPGKLGEPSVQYIPALTRYLLLTYSYPDGLAAGSHNAQHSLWLAYEAPHPWGPWTLISSTDWPTQGFYNPVILNDTATTGTSPTIMFTGDFWDWSQYQMYTSTLTIQH